MGNGNGELLVVLGFAALAALNISRNLKRNRPSRKGAQRHLPASARPDDNFDIDPQLLQGKVEIGNLPLCKVLLVDDSQYAGWLVLVPRKNNLVEVIDLSPEAQEVLWIEVAAAMRAVQGVFNPDKLNQAAIGNLVSQLHVHVAGRKRGDAAWPGVHLGAKQAVPYAPDKLQELAQRFRVAIGEYQAID